MCMLRECACYLNVHPINVHSIRMCMTRLCVSMYTVCTFVCTLYVHFIYIVCTLYVHCMYAVCTLYVHGFCTFLLCIYGYFPEMCTMHISCPIYRGSSQGPSLWENSDPGDALQQLQSEENCAALKFPLRGEDSPGPWPRLLEINILHFRAGYLCCDLRSLI